MEYNELAVKESPGLCRCCLSEGCYKDLGTEYTWMNETEVYADMLIDCFDVGISQHNDGPNGPKRLICEVCITRLRDACNFKKQVLDSEKKFVDMLGRGAFKTKVLIYENEMKSEAVEEMALDEDDLDNTEVEYLDVLDYTPEEEIVKFEDLEPSTAEPSSSSSTVVKKKGKTKKETAEPEKKTAKEKPRKTNKGGFGPSGESMEECNTISSIMRNRRIKHNAITILQYSTAVPFKWFRHNYLCFFCHYTQKTYESIKEHTLSQHKEPNIKSAVSFLRRDEKVKIDISDLECRPCNEKITDLDSFVDHLKIKHNERFHIGGYGVVQYRISPGAYRCGICDKEYQYFVRLNEHMNEHYGQYICDLCGRAFLSSDRLRSHALSHTSPIKCTVCEMSFETVILRKQHEIKIHGKQKIVKCHYCEEKFTCYTARKLHHNSAHGIAMQQYKCPECDKVFHVLSKMEKHLKQVHIKERNFPCNYCEMKFFTNTKLNEHVISHTGAKIFSCDVCNKRFARKNGLKDHMRRHNDVKRFNCNECHQVFITKDYLKRHCRKWHQN